MKNVIKAVNSSKRIQNVFKVLQIIMYRQNSSEISEYRTPLITEIFSVI